ncbi:hypothetical protein [Wolbachia endosymbiont (group E) of Neria commutata]
MKKLLALAVLSTVSFAAPCFGVDFIRDRVYTTAIKLREKDGLY